MITDYATLQTEIAAFAYRDDLTAKIPTFIQLCEADMQVRCKLVDLESNASIVLTAGVGPSLCQHHQIVEPELLDNVLDDLMMLTKGWAFLTVHTKQAAKVLSDGRNAHLIQKPASWWLPKLMQRWELQKFDRTTAGFNVLMKI